MKKPKLVKRPVFNVDFTKDDKRLLELKDIHLGKRAILLGNGPSVRIDDLEQMNNEIIFAANRFYLSYKQFNLKMRPTYTVCIDLLVLKNHGHEVATKCETPLFVSGRVPEIEQFRTDNMIALREFHPPPSTNPNDFLFSDNPLNCIGQGYGVIYTMIQLAVWMGIQKLLLYGIDHTFKLPKDYIKPGVQVTHGGEDNHFIHAYRNQGEKWAPPNYPKTEAGFLRAKDYCETHGIAIYNCTHGGKLEVFERKSLYEELDNVSIPVVNPIVQTSAAPMSVNKSFFIRRYSVTNIGVNLRTIYKNIIPKNAREILSKMRQRVYPNLQLVYHKITPLKLRPYLGKMGQFLFPYQTSEDQTLTDIPTPVKKHIQPIAQRLTPEYFARRDPLIQKLIENIKQGEELYQVLQAFDGTNYDERIVEYPFFVNWLLQRQANLDILDVGCVLNNKLVSNTLLKLCNQVWLSNVAKETEVFVRNLADYHVAPLERSFPDGRQFPLITCLSTIEHIGYDNSQYGIKSPAKYTEPTTEPLVQSLRKLATLLAPAGNMLVSVPYGYREALTHPVTGKTSSQVFDFSSLQEGVTELKNCGVISNIEVFSATHKGWLQVDPKTCKARYADGCPAAGAVAFIKGQKV